MKSSIYNLILGRVRMTSLTSGMTLLHHNYPYLWLKEWIIDTFLYNTGGENFIHEIQKGKIR